MRTGAFRAKRRASVRRGAGKNCTQLSLAEAEGTRGNREEVGGMDEGKCLRRHEC